MSVFIAVLLFSAQAVVAPQTALPAQATTPAPSVKPAKQKLICKVDDADSGTRMSRRVCRTAEEWNHLPQLGAGKSGFSISGESMQSH